MTSTIMTTWEAVEACLCVAVLFVMFIDWMNDRLTAKGKP